MLKFTKTSEQVKIKKSDTKYLFTFSLLLLISTCWSLSLATMTTGVPPARNQALPTTAATPPSAPTNLQATAGNTIVQLTWTPSSSDGGSPFIAYCLYRGTTPGGEEYLCWAGTSIGAWNFVDTGLMNGVTYYYTMDAANSLGHSALTNEVAVVPVGAPPAPSNLQGVGGDGYIALTWTPSISDGGSPFLGYLLSRGTTPGGQDYSCMAGMAVGDSSYTDYGLDNGVTYYYTLYAMNNYGVTCTDEVAVTAGTPPAPPSNLQAIAGDRCVTLTWTPSTSEGGSPFIAYCLYIGTVPGGEQYLCWAGTAIGDNSYVQYNLAYGVTYYFVLDAANSIGHSALSNEVAVTSTPPPPQTYTQTYQQSSPAYRGWIQGTLTVTYYPTTGQLTYSYSSTLYSFNWFERIMGYSWVGPNGDTFSVANGHARFGVTNTIKKQPPRQPLVSYAYLYLVIDFNENTHTFSCTGGETDY